MLRSSYNVFFPTPDFLSMPAFGLDISDESIKYIELITTTKGIKVGRYGECKIPTGIIESGKIQDQEKLQEILVSLLNKEGIRSVRVSLPEEQIYLYKLRLEKAGLESVREAIELSLEEHIPIPAEDANFDYEIINEDEKSLQIQVVAISRGVMSDYLEVFKNTHMAVKSFELEAQAIARAVIRKDDMETYMIVDFGEKRTGISIVSKGIVMFTSTIDIGGIMLTNTIQKNFNVSFEEADKMKKEFGLQRNVENQEIFPVLLNSVSILRDEVSKHFLYWHTHQDEEGKNNPSIKKIILCGGDSNLIGLTDYFSISMKTSVEMANVWVNLINTEESIPDISFRKALSFGAALGLALGDFEKI